MANSIHKKLKSSTTEKINLEAAMVASISPDKFKSASDFKKSLVKGDVLPARARDERVCAGNVVHPPIYNMGVTELQDQPINYYEGFDDGTERIEIRARGTNGKCNLVRIPKKNEGVEERSGFVDQVTFTVRISSLQARKLYHPYDHELFGLHHIDDAIPRISSVLLNIFGFGVSHQRAFGLNHYKHSYHLGDGYGLLGIGGQNNTINIQVFGKGAMMAKVGWEQRLYDYLIAVGSAEAYITRIDIAADFYEGQYSPEQAEREHSQENKFSLTNRRPIAERRGDWYNEGGARTFYVGKRESGKLLRVYEKFKQVIGAIGLKAVGEEHPLFNLKKWVRIECEWHRKHRILEPDMLINPGQYLAASYPALGFISEIQQKVATIKNKVKATVEGAVQQFKHQYGAWLYALIQIKGVSVVRDLVRDDIPNWAKGFDVPPAADDEQWESWEKEMSLIPF